MKTFLKFLNRTFQLFFLRLPEVSNISRIIVSFGKEPRRFFLACDAHFLVFSRGPKHLNLSGKHLKTNSDHHS